MKLRTSLLAAQYAKKCEAWQCCIQVLGYSEAYRLAQLPPWPTLLPYRACQSVPVPKGVG